MRSLRWLALVALSLLGLILFADVPASAQETPGYDPDTAGGVEYQLPLARTRREATGRQADDPSAPKSKGASKPIPLFGAGTGRGATGRQGEGSGASPEAAGEDASSRQSDESGGARAQANTPSSGESPQTENAASDSEGGALQLGLAGGVLVVLLGAVAGIAVRLRARRSEATG